MTEVAMPTPRALRNGVAFFVLLALVIPAGLYFLVDVAQKHQERQAREHVRRQIADVRAGKWDRIMVDNEADEFAMDEFMTDIGDLEGAHPFALTVTYSNHTDDFLKRIAGLRGIRSVHLDTTDVTDAGLEYVATLPDLEELNLYHVRITDAGLEKLKSSASLKSLKLAPSSGITIAAVLDLPHLRKLTLCETYPDHRLEANIAELEQAHSLNELTLIDTKLSPAELEKLRDALPGCRVEEKSNK